MLTVRHGAGPAVGALLATVLLTAAASGCDPARGRPSPGGAASVAPALTVEDCMARQGHRRPLRPGYRTGLSREGHVRYDNALRDCRSRGGRISGRSAASP